MHIRRVHAAVFLAIHIAGFLAVHSVAQSQSREIRLDRDDLCVTEGSIDTHPDGRLHTQSAKMRAIVARPTNQQLAFQFEYLGPTQSEAALGSGALRRQFGIKLRAHDACNLVYAMWRVEPESKVVVQVKSNPGQSRSSECGNRGYQTVRPEQTGPIPALQPSSRHSLSARIEAPFLRVFIDRTEVWRGRFALEKDTPPGSVGIRSDNVRLAFDLSSSAQSYQSDLRQSCPTTSDPSD